MKEVTVKQLTMGSFVKLSGAAGAAFGVLVGIFGFVASLFGADVFIVFGGLPRLTGVVAGIVGIPLMPIVFGLLGMVLALLLYWPFKMVLRMVGGVRLNGR